MLLLRIDEEEGVEVVEAESGAEVLDCALYLLTLQIHVSLDLIYVLLFLVVNQCV